jgi:hypothetical protein
VCRLGDVPLEEVRLSVRPPHPREQGAIAVSATALTKEFEDDTTAAGAKYNGKLLKVTGVISAVSPKWDAVQLAGHHLRPAGPGQVGKQLHVDCQYTTDVVRAPGSLRPSQALTVVGKVQGYVGGNTVVLVDVWVLY